VSPFKRVRRLVHSIGFVLLASATLNCGWASAADLSIVSTVGVRGIIERVRPDFERISGDHVTIKYGTAAALKRQLDAGDSFDVAILTPSLLNDLAMHGTVVGTTLASVARSGIGVAVKAGTAKPSIGTRDALRTALLAPGVVAYTKEGQSGAATAHLFEILGINQAMAGRIYLDARPAGGLLAVAEGKAGMAFALLSEIAVNPQVDLVGPLPDDLQSYVAFAAAMATASKEPKASRNFIAFLGTPAVRRELRNFGMEGGR
jgi:molybdate transport system substrate-binding protein